MRRGRAAKEQKRQEAGERSSSKRSPAEQLKYLDKMGFRAVKERQKIQKRRVEAVETKLNHYVNKIVEERASHP